MHASSASLAVYGTMYGTEVAGSVIKGLKPATHPAPSLTPVVVRAHAQLGQQHCAAIVWRLKCGMLVTRCSASGERHARRDPVLLPSTTAIVGAVATLLQDGVYGSSSGGGEVGGKGSSNGIGEGEISGGN